MTIQLQTAEIQVAVEEYLQTRGYRTKSKPTFDVTSKVLTAICAVTNIENVKNVEIVKETGDFDRFHTNGRD